MCYIIQVSHLLEKENKLGFPMSIVPLLNKDQVHTRRKPSDA